MTPTNYTYTGQYSHTMDFGLMFYNARWYDPALGRFAQADTIVPGGVQGQDRYAYVNNSPMNYVDPSGHLTEDEICTYFGACTEKEIKQYGNIYNVLRKANWGDKIKWKLHGETQVAMLVLFSRDEGFNSEGKYYEGGFWGIEGDFAGMPISLPELLNADKEDGKYVVDITADYKDMTIEELPVADEWTYERNAWFYGSYMQTGHYYDLPGPGIVLTLGAAMVTLPLGFAVGLALTTDFVGMLNLPEIWQNEYDHMFGKITDYPIIYMDSSNRRDIMVHIEKPLGLPSK